MPSTPIEAALDALRSRFANQIAIGFEETFDIRPDRTPIVDLGPSNATLQQVIDRIRHANPNYKIDLLRDGLMHVYPAHKTADPPGLLDLRLKDFVVPPDECIAQQMLNMDNPMAGFSYTPELGAYLWEHKVAWYREHGKEVGGIVGDFMGDCEPAHHMSGHVYHNISVRDALNLMVVRSLQTASGKVPSNAPSWFKPKPISWKYRFRRERDADTGLGGVPLIQSF